MERNEASRLLSDVALAHQHLDAEIAREISRQILPGLPELAEVAPMAEPIQLAFEAHIRAITLSLINSDRPAQPAAMTESFARDCARWDISAGTILNTYQLGHQRLWREWKRRIEDHLADPDARAAVLELCTEVLLDYVTTGMGLTVRVHAAEHEIRSRGAAWQQRDDVLAFLDGRVAGSESDLSRRLNHSLDRWHVGFVCRAADEAGQDWAGAYAAGRVWAPVAADVATLIIPVDSTTSWGWISSTREPTWPAEKLPPAGDGFRVALGTAAHGAAGFRSTHEEAVRALTVAAHRPAGVVRYEDVATVAMLVDDPAALRRFLARQLGGLAGAGERELRLRATVAAYLDSGENVRAVARDLNFHRNTIQQRLELAAELRGRPLEEDRTGFALALLIAEHYQDLILSDDRGPTPRG